MSRFFMVQCVHMYAGEQGQKVKKEKGKNRHWGTTLPIRGYAPAERTKKTNLA